MEFSALFVYTYCFVCKQVFVQPIDRRLDNFYFVNRLHGSHEDTNKQL